MATETFIRVVVAYAPAAREAKEKNKNLLIVFTGSDWIEICKTFLKDILSQPDFVNTVSEKYVLLKLEFPQNNRLPADIAREYQLLKDAYRVRGFPTVILTDADGKPFGINGYQPLAAAEYAKVMVAFVKGRELRDEMFAKAGSQSGLEKAKTLLAGIPDLPGTLPARFYREEMKQVVALDPEDKTGYARQFKQQIDDVEYAAQMQKLGADVQYDKMIELTDTYIKEQKLNGQPLQKALLNKLGVQRQMNNTAGSAQTLLEIISADPESPIGKSAQKMLDNLRSQKNQEDLKK